MPRDSSGVYRYPDGTKATSGETIASLPYNTYLDDMVTDSNGARPITAGGTGATTVVQALTNLGAERAGVLVTNFDSHLWTPGSFYCAASTTGAPNAHAFAGTCYSSDPVAAPPANLNVIVEARDQQDSVVPGKMYVREKKAGVWGPWVSETAVLESTKVAKSGDTMTGNLTLNFAHPSMYFLATGSSQSAGSHFLHRNPFLPALAVASGRWRRRERPCRGLQLSTASLQ